MNFQDTIIKVILEAAHQAYTDTESPNYDPYAGPIARKYGKTRMKKRPKIADPVVARGARAATRRLQRKVPGANPQLQHMVQAALLKRRGKRGGLPKARPEDERADARRDVWRRQAPGDK